MEMEIPKQVYSDLIMIEHRTYSGKSDHEGITSSFFGGGILYRLNFNVTSYSLVEQGILRVDQVGALENPMLRIPLTYQNLTKVSFEPIIWNIRNAFRFIAQLPGLTQVEFKLPKRNFVVPDFIAFDMDDEIERTEFVNQSVNKLWIGVDLACFASMTPEMKKRILVFLTNILNVSSICFPGLKKLCLELPGEKTHTMYIAVFELISKSPGLAKAIILTDMGNSRITCTCDFYTGPIRAVQNGTIPQQTDPESIKKTGDSSLAACTSSSGSPKSPSHSLEVCQSPAIPEAIPQSPTGQPPPRSTCHRPGIPQQLPRPQRHMPYSRPSPENTPDNQPCSRNPREKRNPGM